MALWFRGATTVIPKAHHLVIRPKLYLQGQGRRQATQGTNYKDGSGHGFCCLSDPNAWPCHLSVRQRTLLLAQVSAKFPPHSIWNVLLARLSFQSPSPLSSCLLTLGYF